jgi:hypothetical protein
MKRIAFTEIPLCVPPYYSFIRVKFKRKVRAPKASNLSQGRVSWRNQDKSPFPMPFACVSFSGNKLSMSKIFRA